MARIYLSPPHVGVEERELLLEAFDSNWIAPLGPHVDAFERELAQYCGVEDAAALASGTAALHLALILLGVGAGDHVLVSDLTFAASANVVRYVGATPVFVDCDAQTWTIDPELVAEAIADLARKGRPPKALIAVDLYGQCADYSRLLEVCGRYDVPIIQDASESLGATYRGRPAGAQGVMAAFSFNGNKIITTSGGGMLVSNRRDWISSARNLAAQAREPAPHYEHTKVGYNYRLSNLLAALGRAQLRALEARVQARRANFDWYAQRLSRSVFEFMPEASYGRATRWLTCATLERNCGLDRDVLRVALERDDIEARPVWKPMHLQPVYKDCRMFGGAVGRRLFEAGICLPSGSNLTPGDRERVLSVILKTMQERGLS